MNNLFNEANQIHNFRFTSGAGTVSNYGSGSDFFNFLTTVRLVKKLRFLRFRFQLHNTGQMIFTV